MASALRAGYVAEKAAQQAEAALSNAVREKSIAEIDANKMRQAMEMQSVLRVDAQIAPDCP